ncbi:MAG TPA: DUF1571 domain-containing protein, partial [Isosphaeraceae bacterium]|nr:DUF1571 domain-containing protein [Isosphaeraceae bacterium]
MARVLAVVLLVLPPGLLALGWWLTAPLTVRPAVATPIAAAVPVKREMPAVVHRKCEPRGWPEKQLSGDAAKRILLDSLLTAASRLERIEGYTATFHRQERIAGKLGPAQKLELKLRHRPFSVYLKFIEPDPGKEVVYAEGQFDNKMIAHASGFARRLLPRLAVAPTSPLALSENRHPITDAGLLRLTRMLVRFREMDLADPEAVTILDRTCGHDGCRVYRSLHTHPHRHAERPFARVEVLYDPTTLIPIEITSYDWPEGSCDEPLRVAEHYSYDNLELSAELSDL